MIINFIDSHLHLQNYEDNAPAVMKRAAERGCSTYIVNSTSPADWDDVIKLSNIKGYSVIPFIGVHPWYIKDEYSCDEYGRLLEEVLINRGCGVGEIGLDRICKDVEYKRQMDVFSLQLDLAAKYKRPVSIHSVRSHNEVVAILRGMQACPKFMVHSFRGSPEMIREITGMGGYISLSLSIVKSGYVKCVETVKSIPVERLLLESDSPDQKLPDGDLICKYGIECDYGAVSAGSPENMACLYNLIAGIKGIDMNSLADIITENFKEFVKDI